MYTMFPRPLKIVPIPGTSFSAHPLTHTSTFYNISGLYTASRKLREHYTKEMINLLIDLPFSTSEFSQKWLSREENYIDLAVLTLPKARFRNKGGDCTDGVGALDGVDSYTASYIEEMEDKENEEEEEEEGMDKVDGSQLERRTLRKIGFSDRQTFMKQQYLDMRHLDLEEIVEAGDHRVFVRGIAGIGKSTLLDMLTFRWARKKLLVGASREEDGVLKTTPKIELLFIFECREINTMDDFKTMGELLQFAYPNIFSYVSLNDLKELSHQTLIIFDGIDELEHIYTATNYEKFASPTKKLNKVAVIVDTLKQLDYRIIVGGRPKACEQIQREVKRRSSIKRSRHCFKTVEVCGFNTESIEKYIRNFFSCTDDSNEEEQQQQLEKAIKARRLINNSKNLKVMSSVPVLLFIICNVFKEDLLVEKSIHTNTELYFYGCLVFLQSNLRGNYSSHNLNDLMQDDNFCEILYSLSVLSVETYMKHKVVFTEEDVQNVSRKCLVHLEETGFFRADRKFNKVTYQFKHLVFQEFLCALNLCLTKGIRVYLNRSELKDCSLTVMGIYHLYQEGKNEILKGLFERMLVLMEKTSSRRDEKAFEKFIHDQRKSYGLKLEKDIQQLIVDGNLNIDMTQRCSNFMAKVFEIKHKFSKTTIAACKNLYAHVNELALQTDQRNAIYLLEALEVKHITFLTFTFNELSPDIIKLITMSKSSSKTKPRKLTMTFLDPMSVSKVSRVISTKNISLFINYQCHMNKLPEELKALGEYFSVRGPLRCNQEMSSAQKSILMDLTEYVIHAYPPKKLYVYDGPKYLSSSTKQLEEANKKKSRLLVDEFDHRDNFNLCVLICENTDTVHEHNFIVETK